MYTGPTSCGPSTNGFPAASVIEPADDRFSPNVPLPLPVDAVTVHDAPDPVTPVTAGAAKPPAATSAKSDAATPVTDSENATFHDTDPA